MRLCQGFVDSVNDVTLLGYKNKREVEDDPIEYYGLKGGFNVILNFIPPWLHNRVLAKLQITKLILGILYRKHIQEIKPDVVYSRLTVWELLFVPRDIPIIYEMHSLFLLQGNFYERWSMRYIIKRKNFKRFVVTTDRLQNWLQEIYPDYEVVVARLSAEKPIQLDEVESNTFKCDHIKGSYELNIGYTGFLDRSGYRGIDVLLKIADAMPEVGVHIVGGDPDVVEYWKKKTSASNLFFYGFQNPKYMPFYLKALDIMLSPLQFQKASRAPTGKGMALLKIPQYLSYGVCIVASRLPAHEEVLTDGVNVVLVTPDSIEEWVRAINDLSGNHEMIRQLGENAETRYWEEMTPSKRVEKILAGIDD
jgi:glycosyltransferase involved in cell wall biosynthesis